MREDVLRIDCYLAQDCASEQALRDHIREALRLETVNAEVSFTRLTEPEAQKLGLRGSPSVLVDGEDILPSSVSGFSGRVFEDESGRLANVPSVEFLRQVIRKRLKKETVC